MWFLSYRLSLGILSVSDRVSLRALLPVGWKDQPDQPEQKQEWGGQGAEGENQQQRRRQGEASHLFLHGSRTARGGSGQE